MYPVEVAYLQESTADYVRKAAETVWNIHMQVCVSYITLYGMVPMLCGLAKSRRHPSLPYRT